ncbi:MAG: ferritin family protein [Nitrospiraceae bacterium]|nr:ferritin family protein [Nitrospiraceae bacterium]
MERYSMTEIVEQAVQTEKLGYRFYTSMMERFRDDRRLKDLFTTLASAEVKHEKKFMALKDTVKDAPYEDMDEVSLYLRAISESEFFLGKGKSLPSLDHVKTIDDAVAFAIGFEKETLLYFHAVRDIVGDKGLVDAIIDEEKSHIIWLSKFRMGLAPLK